MKQAADGSKPIGEVKTAAMDDLRKRTNDHYFAAALAVKKIGSNDLLIGLHLTLGLLRDCLELALLLRGDEGRRYDRWGGPMNEVATRCKRFSENPPRPGSRAE